MTFHLAFVSQPHLATSIYFKNECETVAAYRRTNRLKKGHKSISSCCQTAQQYGVALLVDAEEYSMQIATDQLVLDLMREFNLNKAVVYNTIQLYLVDGNRRLEQMHIQAIKDSFYLGVKLVRGAYMEKERKIAHKTRSFQSHLRLKSRNG